MSGYGKLAAAACFCLLLCGGGRGVAAEESGDDNITTIHKVELSEGVFPPGSSIKIGFLWESQRPARNSSNVFVLIFNEAGEIVEQLDHEPDVQTGSPGWIGRISYTRNFRVPAGMPEGKYQIYAGLTRKNEAGKPVNQKLLVGPGVTEGRRNRYLVGGFTVDRNAPLPPRDTERPATLDLSAFTLVFDEDFNEGMSISRASGGTRWKSHTPWWGDYGDARFVDHNPGEADFLEDGFPFTIVNEIRDEREPAREYRVSGGVLRIEMRKNSEWIARDQWKRQWAAGLLATTNRENEGFSLQYGYFEARMKMPPGPGVWPAFWLSSAFDRTLKGEADPGNTGTVEIDVVEYYGRSPDSYQCAQHVWSPPPHVGEGNTVSTRPGEPAENFNNYGVLVMPDFITYYFNGVEVWKRPTPKEHNKPLLLLVNLAAGSGWPIDKMISPSYLYVDYVRAYAPKK